MELLLHVLGDPVPHFVPDVFLPLPTRPSVQRVKLMGYLTVDLLSDFRPDPVLQLEAMFKPHFKGCSMGEELLVMFLRAVSRLKASSMTFEGLVWISQKSRAMVVVVVVIFNVYFRLP